jgi:hypothetical protein
LFAPLLPVAFAAAGGCLNLNAGSDAQSLNCSPSILRPLPSEVLGVDQADLIVRLPPCATFRVQLNGVDITKYFKATEDAHRASLWETELPGLTPTGNTLRITSANQPMLLGSASTSVTFGVDTSRFLVIRDNWNIPHVYGYSQRAAFYGMGFVTAEEDGGSYVVKAWGIAGRGAELKGKEALANDYDRRLYRTYEKVEEDWHTLNEETKRAAEAFADGMNAYHRLHPRDPNLPEIDAKMVFAVARAPDTNRAHQVAGWELGYGEMIQRTGEDVWRDLHPAVNGPPVIRKRRSAARTQKSSPAAAHSSQKKSTPNGKRLPDDIWDQYARRLSDKEIGGDAPTNGSFTWIVTPEKSQNGKTLMGGVFAFPEHTVTLELHVTCPGYDAIGLLGGPNLDFGHNRYLTWWRTRTNPDTGDVYEYQVKVDAAGYPTHYLRQGQWLATKKVMLPLKYKEGNQLKSAPLPAFYTTDGLPFEFLGEENDRPVITVLKGNKYYAYVVNLADYHDAEQLTPALQQMKAKTFDELRDAVAPQHYSIFSTTAADRNGEIFFLYNGKIPLRANEPINEWNESGHWVGAFDGTAGQGTQVGYVPFGEIPLYDSRTQGKPDEGYLLNMGAGSNIWVPRQDLLSYPRGLFEWQSVLGQDPAATFSGNGWYFAALDFDERLSSMVKDKVTFDQMAELAFSTHCPMINWYRDVLFSAYASHSDLITDPFYKAEAERTIEVLKGSSNYAELDNRSIVLWNTWLRKLADETFKDELDSLDAGLYDDFMDTLHPAKHGKIHFLLSLIYLPEKNLSPQDTSFLLPYVDNLNRPGVQTKEENAVYAYEAALRDILEDPEKLEAFGGTTTPLWGDVFKETYNGKTFARFGAPRTLGCVEEKDHVLLSGLGANEQEGKYRTIYKAIWQLGPDGIEAKTIVARNQGTKHMGEPHFFDQGELYQQRKFKDSYFTWADVTAHEESRQVIPID